MENERLLKKLAGKKLVFKEYLSQIKKAVNIDARDSQIETRKPSGKES
jgi:hypothetical protein